VWPAGRFVLEEAQQLLHREVSCQLKINAHRRGGRDVCLIDETFGQGQRAWVDVRVFVVDVVLLKVLHWANELSPNSPSLTRHILLLNISLGTVKHSFNPMDSQVPPFEFTKLLNRHGTIKLC